MKQYESEVGKFDPYIDSEPRSRFRTWLQKKVKEKQLSDLEKYLIIENTMNTNPSKPDRVLNGITEAHAYVSTFIAILQVQQVELAFKELRLYANKIGGEIQNPKVGDDKKELKQSFEVVTKRLGEAIIRTYKNLPSDIQQTYIKYRNEFIKEYPGFWISDFLQNIKAPTKK